MGHISFQLAALAAAGMLVACGGGSDSPPAPAPTPTPNATINGVAATGAALANAALTAKCATGATLGGRTAADGSYTLEFTGGQTAPCMVEAVSGNITLHGYADAAGRANITPLTELAITRALGSPALAAFANYTPATATALKAGLDAAKAYVKTEVTALAGSYPATDPFTGTFKVGDADDKVLDALVTALTTANKKLDDLRLAAVTGQPLAAAVARGTLVEPAVVLATLTKAQIDGGPLLQLTGPAKCDVKVVSLNYNTIGVKGEKTNSSGVMLVPAGTCTASASLVAYAKGTDVQKPRTLANPGDSETFLLAAFYAAQGYAVVATDYLGYAKSTYSYHPYLHADSEATTVIDSIRAARNAAGTAGATLSGKVMVTGYSQGGHASMAAHRAIERDNAAEINVVAGAHLAGPYNLSGATKSTNAIAGYQFFTPFLVTSYQKVYGDVYSNVTQAFKPPYDGYIETLLPNPTLNTTTLVTSGKLPGGTPAQARDLIFQPGFLLDSQTNPNNALFLDSKKNDLFGWNPKAKVLLCGGAGDPTVPPALHQAPMKADFDSRQLTNITSVDVDAMVQATYGSGGVAPTDPTSAAFATYYGSYHGSYEPPFCHLRAKASFDAVN